MLAKIILIAILLIPVSLAYASSNSELNITIMDDYNSYSSSNSDLNIALQANMQAYTASNNDLNLTFFYFSSYGQQVTTTSTGSTTTPTTVPSSSGGGSGSSGGSSRSAVTEKITERIIERPIENIREVIREPQIIYREVTESPYRLSSVLLSIILIVLLSIRISDFISQRKKTVHNNKSALLRKKIKSKLKKGHKRKKY